jgi:hypothetical protein
MKILFLIVLQIIFCSNINSQIPISFSSEYIDFSIDNEYFSINGIYTFNNKTNKEVNFKILFPFGISTSQIDSIRVIDLKNFQNILYRKNEFDISFFIALLPFDSVEYNIFYRQVLSKKNVYILTTTKVWNAPLENARYCLTVIDSIKVGSLSMNPDSIKSDKNITTYYWKKQNFMPQKDFEVVISK